MLEQQQPIGKRIEPLFYFKFQMRLEFIPFIEQEIKEFITFIEGKINKAEHIPQILVILNKRIRDIDRFYDQNWSDYRAQQILRSRQQLVEFCKTNHAQISNRTQIIKAKNDPSPMKQEESPIDKGKEKKKQSIQPNKSRESPVDKAQAINFEIVKQSSSRSKEKEVKERVHKYPVSSKGSPFVASPALHSPSSVLQSPSPVLQSPSLPIKSSVSRERLKDSPIQGVKLKESPMEKRPARKMTKEQYILHLRNKKKQL